VRRAGFAYAVGERAESVAFASEQPKEWSAIGSSGPGGRSGKGRGLRAGLRVRLVSGDLLGRGPTSAKTLGH
jgi:hypothetical protein